MAAAATTGRAGDRVGNELTSALTSGSVGLGLVRRIAVLGARGVGKSALTIRLCEGTFPESYLPTIEDTYQTAIRGRDNQLYTCEVIDTAGQDEFSPLGAQATIGVDGYVLLYSVRDATSFEMAQYINDRLLTTLGSEQVPRILVGNQIDYASDREVTRDQGEQAARLLDAAFCECSAKTGANTLEVFRALLEEIDRAGADGLDDDDEEEEKEETEDGVQGAEDASGRPLRTAPAGEQYERRDGKQSGANRRSSSGQGVSPPRRFTDWADEKVSPSPSGSALLSRCITQ
ncbi:hypothetical protein CDCA_CDCA02G0603 [Cyanidium caldarium]|uniref:Uncharacterized protein n=1 Tax=Cyanidium caldarium TaxID=2771 RepID=A0AAV9IRC4_CYACA|nr:hypothetical protein CDCA_CDCA02G0603 [Cyanidium caldarium]